MDDYQELIEQLRSFEIDHEPDGWPGVRMRQISAMCDAIESLRQQLVEKDAEVERLKAENRDACIGLNDYFGQQLAASQLRERQLREAAQANYDLHKLYDIYDGYIESGLASTNSRTLALPSDTTALSAMIAKVSEVMRQRAISAGSAINPIYGAGAAIDAIRALPNVMLEDLK